jgi:hypothetical protein
MRLLFVLLFCKFKSSERCRGCHTQCGRVNMLRRTLAAAAAALACASGAPLELRSYVLHPANVPPVFNPAAATGAVEVAADGAGAAAAEPDPQFLAMEAGTRGRLAGDPFFLNARMNHATALLQLGHTPQAADEYFLVLSLVLAGYDSPGIQIEGVCGGGLPPLLPQLTSSRVPPSPRRRASRHSALVLRRRRGRPQPDHRDPGASGRAPRRHFAHAATVGLEHGWLAAAAATDGQRLQQRAGGRKCLLHARRHLT